MMKYNISGPEGNAFAIMGNVKTWSKQLEMDSQPIIEEMASGDYNNLLRVVVENFGDIVEFVSEYELDTVNPDLYTIK